MTPCRKIKGGQENNESKLCGGGTEHSDIFAPRILDAFMCNNPILEISHMTKTVYRESNYTKS